MLSSEQRGLPSLSMRRSAPGQLEADTEHSLIPCPACWTQQQQQPSTLCHSWLLRPGLAAAPGLREAQGPAQEHRGSLRILFREDSSAVRFSSWIQNYISKIILNLKNSLSLWYLLVPNFWNSPGLGAMLFCARFLLLCIGIKDRSEGSLQHVPLLVCYRLFSKVFQKQNISHILIQWRTQKLGFPRLIDIGQIYIRPRHYFWLVLWGWVLFITLQTDVQGNLQQVPQSTVQHLERKVNETAKHSIIFCQNWDIFPKTSLWGGG